MIWIFLSTSPLFYFILYKIHTYLCDNYCCYSFLEIFKYWILSYLQVHVFTILLKVFKGGECKKIQHYNFSRIILIYRANIGKRAILCQNIGIIGHFQKDRDFIGNIMPLEGLLTLSIY